MSEAKEQNNKRPKGQGVGPTQSFDGTTPGPGGQIGPFRIERELGRGGAGVVYLAHDTKLDRSVAIKSLPVELMENPKARTRFKREARVLASLNHPNIGTIYDELQEAKGVGYLILEYIPGQTLAERIAGVRLKLQEVLSIAQQIAEAVAAAHEHDVIHRDLKPGNIKITPEGKVKVLDFGLAKAVGGEATDQQSTVTEPGRIIGTPAYMSPEQARGQMTDKRSDIWSFGCVLYEMLTGKVPFEGETVSDTLAGILDQEPDWHALPQATPANIQVLLRRCLEKDPRRRLRDIGDAGIEINETLSLSVTALPVSIPAKPRRMTMMIGAAIIIVLSAIAVWFTLTKQAQPPSREKVLVVLPFANLGPPNDEYFADGITDAITARLAVIQGLSVISRQSAMQYKEREKNTRQIAEELGVDYILEGTVQRERPSDPTSKVRIIPQLIRASDDIHVWAETYDDDMREVFQLQSDLAEHVAQALDITLLEPERQALKAKPTENMEAYDYYMRGNVYSNRSYDMEDQQIALKMYQRAVELEPTFALAHVRLAETHGLMYWLHHVRTEECLDRSLRAAKKALQLDPDLPEAHLALGSYYYLSRLDYNHALEEFDIARKSRPNNSKLIAYIGYVQQSQGKFEQAAINIGRACELDPRSHLLAYELAWNFFFIPNYPEAVRSVDRAISLAPDFTMAYALKAWLYIFWKGNIEKARAVLEEALQNIKSTENAGIVSLLVGIDVLKGNYQEALDTLEKLPAEAKDDVSMLGFTPYALRCARIYRYMNKKELEQASYESACTILESMVKEYPEDWRFHGSLGVAYAGLGRKEEAIREGELAVELLPLSKDAIVGILPATQLASIYVMVGEFDKAIDQLGFLRSKSKALSILWLRLNPEWTPLHDHPRFKKLLEEEE